ncbi:hypothetical protein TIFTF001_016241 [Ficus carica]|uniref:Putative plant transposon protein domain-containing protein n=1 Tax=Ficus carica TaxID=3494 RepID=A0AA88D600_FICCA|nr:hypothetical protein TIFTF001_016241 [Ficus carica]
MKFLETKVSIPDRGFLTSNRRIMDIVADQGWENFAKQLESSVPAVVYEFYANAYFPQDVIEKWVPISRTIINQYYGLQDIEEDGYQRYLDNVDPDEVKSSICAFNTAWKIERNGILVKFSTRGLDKYGKAWHQFVCAKLMPVWHVSRITKDRAILLFAILTNKSIDVGRVIYHQITQSVRNPKLGLYFLSLITDLCKHAEVTWEGHEIWEGPHHPINDGVIASYKEGDDDAEHEPPRPHRPVSTMSVP